jgi:hypothetical protein
MRLTATPAVGLSLLALTLSLPATAQTALPGLTLGTPDPASFYGALLNQWYVAATQVSAGTLIDGTPTQSGSFGLFPAPGSLAGLAESQQQQGGKAASALGSLSATKLGAAATAAAALDPQATGMVAVGYSMLSYWAVLDQDVTVRFSLPLEGRLTTTGNRSLGPDASLSGVVAWAHGSQTNPTNAGQAALFANAGIDVNAEGEALLRQLATVQPSTQTHLAVFGAQADTLHPTVDVNSTLEVTAQGTRIDCTVPIPGPLSAICGRYFYFMNVALFTGAQNGAQADFSHTLSVASYSIDGATAQPFNAVSVVPEPGPAPLFGLGLAGLAALRWQRRRRA